MLHLIKKTQKLEASDSPRTTPHFLRWRLDLVRSHLELLDNKKRATTEAKSFFGEVKTSQSQLLAMIKKEERPLLLEKTFLLSQRKVLAEDLSDIVESKQALDDAYIKELRISLEPASPSQEKSPGLESPRLDRPKFQKLVFRYLRTRKVTKAGNVRKFCNVLGHLLQTGDVRCAHIIPFSWNNKAMGHMFGSLEPPLTSRRNGLGLQTKIEKAFDKCWLAIVPSGSIDATPTEWKVVLLNPHVRDEVFFVDVFKITGRRSWRYKDIDGRKLTFRNQNRPARRFLYLRYTLAWLHAEQNSWPDFKTKVPPGDIWATPNKPEGYLRKSILVSLGKKTGDKLPQELVNVGMFEDPDSSSVVADEVASMAVIAHIQSHLEGERDTENDEEVDEE